MKYQLDYAIKGEIISRIFEQEEDARQWAALVMACYPSSRVTLYSVNK